MLHFLEDRYVEFVRSHRQITFFVLIIDDMSIGQPALMQDTRNYNASALLAVKHDVLGMLQTVQTRANVITKSPNAGLSASVWQQT